MISLSFASVLVTSENSRIFPPNAAPIARPAASRTERSRIRQLVQRGTDGQVLAAQRHTHARDRLVEQPAPRAAPGHLLLVQQLLQVVGKLVRPEHAQVAQPRPPSGQRRLRELLLQRRLVQPVELEREEQQVAADRRSPARSRSGRSGRSRHWWSRPRTATGRRTSAGPAPPRSARIRRSPRRAHCRASRQACPCERRRRRAPPARPWRSRPRRPGCPERDRGRRGPRSAGSPQSVGWRRRRPGRNGASWRPREAAVLVHVR